MALRRFPAGFLWGTASSAHQHEGGNTNNQWSAWEQQPGRIWHGDVSGDACGWWHDIEPDLDRAQGLGLNSHRMSIEWSRIEPREGEWDTEATARYREMLIAVRARGLEPMITLHHFTNPLWLERVGAWVEPRTPERFARFTQYVVEQFGDLCHLWCTINEPTIYAGMSYLEGLWPPGVTNFFIARRVLSALLRGHAAAAKVIHAAGPQHKVGIVHNLHIMHPGSRHLLDRMVARMADELVNGTIIHALHTGYFSRPFGTGVSPIPDLRGSSDFFGLNYYGRTWIRFDTNAPAWTFSRGFIPPHVEQSDYNSRGQSYGEVYPSGIYNALKRASSLELPIYITETGLPDSDDDQRPRFILNHLAEVHRAIHEGVDVRGLFFWSLLDNFEWAWGYDQRFGIVRVDYDTHRRTVKDSGRYYAEVVKAHTVR